MKIKRNLLTNKNLLTNLDKFISRSTRMTIVFSRSSLFARLTAPSVRNTDKIFRKPKS
jgi:hypothetical protein